MDLPVIGAHCESERCGDLDFLPIKCTGCQKVFCRHHIAFDSHSCSSLEKNRDIPELSEELNAKHKRERCAHEGCYRPTLESVIVDTTEPEHRVVATCPECSCAFCAVHRHPSDHVCENIPPPSSPSQKNPEAHALLTKHFPATSSSSKVSSVLSKPPTDPKKLARLRAVELMKMRHHAVPVDPKDKTAAVPPTQRIHIKVVSTGTAAPTEQIFWLRKTVSTGKALDLIADRLSMRISDTTLAFLDKLPSGSGTSTRLRNDKLLSEQIEDGETLKISLGT